MIRPAYPPRRPRGFTLIELAIVVAIIGFISVGFLRVFETLRTQTGRTDTVLTLDEAEDALRRYLLENRRLPCPAGRNLTTDNANYAREAALINGCDPAIITAIPNQIGTTDYAGLLPVRDLGLSGDRATDGWERQLSYQVSREAILQNALEQPGWGANNLVFADAASTGNVNNAIRAPAVVVIWSHGPNGNGAVTVDGGQLQAPPGGAADELENTDFDRDFVQGEFSEDQDAPYDDVLRALSERELTDPLIERGVLEEPLARARKQLERIEAALLAYVAGNRTPVGIAAPDPDGQPSPVGCDCSLTSVPPMSVCNVGSPPAICNVCEPRDATAGIDLLPPGAVGEGCERSVHRGLPPPAPAAVSPFGGIAGGNGVPLVVLAGGVPLNALGLPVGEDIDPWGNPIRYMVSVNATVNPVIPPGDVDAGIRASSLEAGFIIWSDGPNRVNDSVPFDPLGAPLPIDPTTTSNVDPNFPPVVTFLCGDFALLDDICLQRTTSDIVGALSRAGIRFDN